MNLKLTGKRALVMGGSTGIGFGVARTLIEEGASVVICSRNEATLAASAKTMKAESHFAIDLSKPGSGKTAVQEAIKRLGGIDILVTNTGGPPKGMFAEISASQWLEGFQGLFVSVADSMKEALPVMTKQKWGRIVLITSTAAKEPIPTLTVSNGIRAGILGLMKSVSTEVAIDGVTINAIMPGFVDTDRLKELGITKEQVLAGVPAKRMGTIAEIGALAAFLASEQAAYITGQAISCDGGRMKSY